MQGKKSYPDILTGKKQLGPYPMEKLKKVHSPTTRITDSIPRFDEREQKMAKAARGDYKNWRRTDETVRNAKDPLMANFSHLLWSLPPVDNGIEVRMPPMLFGVPDRSKLMPLPAELSPAHRLSLETTKEKRSLPDDPAVISRHIKILGYFLGADVMGICKLPQWALYSHDMNGKPIANSHKYAICIVRDMDYRNTSSTTGYDWFGGIGPQWAYLSSAFIASLMAAYIRKLGYPARVQHAQNYQTLITPLLLLSGIGELSRPGLVLNPFLGLRFKAAAITTDLPLESDSPVDFGLQDFCDKCKKCAQHCPSQSISYGNKIMRNGYETWEFESESCTKMRVTNPKGNGCGSCVHVCPWNKQEGWTHDLVRWMVAHTPLMNRFFVKMDDVLGYGHPDIGNRWQLEFE
jgi:reductive dehalogenase